MDQVLVPFVCEALLTDALIEPLCRVSLLEDRHGECGGIILWQSEQRGVRVFSQMHSVAERLEVGVLHFTPFEVADQTSKVFHFDPSVKVKAAYKLLIREAGIALESGLKLAFEAGTELVIRPAAFPCFLAISGDRLPELQMVPEYELEDYEAIPMFIEDTH